VPESRVGDSEYRIKFPGMNNTALSIDVPDTLRRGVTAECPDPARRYAGGNRGCWSNEAFDRFYLLASTSLDATERSNAVLQALKIITEDVGILGLSYNSEAIPVPKGLVGPGARWPAQIGNTWNVHEWRWE
jgi:ABC-type transport system substrate-binding protein